MSNVTMKEIAASLIQKQRDDVMQVAKYKEKIQELDNIIRERAQAISLLEAASNAEMRNVSIAQILKY